MSRTCEMCGKGAAIGNSVSHSNRKTLRPFLPNIVTKKVGGKTTKLCTKCLKTVHKVAK